MTRTMKEVNFQFPVTASDGTTITLRAPGRDEAEAQSRAVFMAAGFNQGALHVDGLWRKWLDELRLKLTAELERNWQAAQDTFLANLRTTGSLETRNADFQVGFRDGYAAGFAAAQEAGHIAQRSPPSVIVNNAIELPEAVETESRAIRDSVGRIDKVVKTRRLRGRLERLGR